MNTLKTLLILIIITVSTNMNAIAQQLNSNDNHIIKLETYEKDGRQLVEWSTDENSSVNYWQVQGSNDGKEFKTIALVLGADPTEKGNSFKYRSDKTSKAKLFYRLLIVNNDGTQTFSEIIRSAK